jgi:hypothetical protein
LREGSGGEFDLAVPATVLPSTTTVDMELSEVQSKGIDTSLHAFQGYDVSHFRSSFFSVEICPFEKHIWRKRRRIIKDRNSFTFYNQYQFLHLLGLLSTDSLLGLQINKRNCFF